MENAVQRKTREIKKLLSPQKFFYDANFSSSCCADMYRFDNRPTVYRIQDINGKHMEKL